MGWQLWREHREEKTGVLEVVDWKSFKEVTVSGLFNVIEWIVNKWTGKVFDIYEGKEYKMWFEHSWMLGIHMYQ